MENWVIISENGINPRPLKYKDKNNMWLYNKYFGQRHREGNKENVLYKDKIMSCTVVKVGWKDI
jgi:hypothetical protein